MPTRLIATSFALTAFATAVLAGLVADHAAAIVLWRALIAMLGCYVVGLIIGGLACRALQDQIERYKREHPIDDDAPSDASGELHASIANTPTTVEQQTSADAPEVRTTTSQPERAAA